MSTPMTSLCVGLAGGSGSGKTTFAHRIADGIPPEAVALIPHDHYYRDHPNKSFEDRAQLNFDHPDALETSLLVQHLEHLRAGNPIERPIYDFTTHRRREETVRIEPRPIIIVEGILTFVDPRLRACFDIKVWVDTDADIRLMRRIRRDIEERGRDFASVRRQYYDTVRPMYDEFVGPSRRTADLIIPEGGANRVALDLILARLRAAI